MPRGGRLLESLPAIPTDSPEPTDLRSQETQPLHELLEATRGGSYAYGHQSEKGRLDNRGLQGPYEVTL